jgi:radical SAM superfamily enzyme YgiQ (UPF0313 family)
MSLVENKFKHVCIVSSGQVSWSRAPAALAFMAGVCEKNQIEYNVIDLNVEFLHQAGKEHWYRLYSAHPLDNHATLVDDVLKKFFFDTIEKIKLTNTDCLAITVLSFMQHRWAQQFLTQLKDQAPHIKTIAGGPGISSGVMNSTSFGKTLVDQGVLDYYVLGEGDIVFDKFLNGEFEQLGLNYKGVDQTWQPQIDNLNVLPIPSYKKINLENYQYNRKVPQVIITGSRGCVRRCTFCDVGHHWKKFKFRTGKNIADEMLTHYLETNVTDFFFNDSLINGSLKQFYNLLETLNEYKQTYPGLSNINYEGQFIIRPQGQHNERMYQLMSASGCKTLYVGVESGSEKVRDHMGKKFSNADIDYHFEMCEKYGISNWILIMCSYPTETQQDFEDTLDMFKRNQKYLINDTIIGASISFPTLVLPNTPLNNMAEELQIHFLDREESIQHSKLDTFDHASVLFESRLNPDLTVTKKYQRWVDLIETAATLGYRLNNTTMSDVQANLDTFIKFKNPNKKVWTIAQAKENYYS